MKLKMWVGNLDGYRVGAVVATSKEKARKAVGTGRADFDGFWAEQKTVDASLAVETLYTKPYDDRKVPWQAGRCEIPK